MLNLKLYPNSILKKKAEEVKAITPEIKELALAMIETMEKNQGVGLAAPQIGVSKRIIIVQTKSGAKTLINPKVIKRGKTTEKEEEGCLSLPGVFLKVKRFKEIEIEASDLDGKKVQIKAEDFPARIFQHEIDHLDGFLIVDRISFSQKIKSNFKRCFQKNI